MGQTTSGANALNSAPKRLRLRLFPSDGLAKDRALRPLTAIAFDSAFKEIELVANCEFHPGQTAKPEIPVTLTNDGSAASNAYRRSR
jgi:hypothetical protein